MASNVDAKVIECGGWSASLQESHYFEDIVDGFDE